MRNHPGLVNSTIAARDVPTEQPRIVARLRAVFDRLDDAPLLQALIGPTRRGPKGHPVLALWRCFILKHYLGLPSTEAMRRALQDNPYLCQAVGISWPDQIPHHSTFSRFLTKLTKRKHLHLVKEVSRSLVRHHYDTIPGFGERVALDSTTLKAWCNGAKPIKSDKQAWWLVKSNSHGKPEYTFGYKLHLAICAETEMPIAANISPGHVNDAKRASNVLSEARFTYKRKFRPRFVLADKGYSGRGFLHLVRTQYWATPVVQINPGHKVILRQEGKFIESREWRAIYSQRPSVERAFSRLKGQRSLNRITTRGLWKVTIHCYLSLIAMQAAANLERVHLEQ